VSWSLKELRLGSGPIDGEAHLDGEIGWRALKAAEVGLRDRFEVDIREFAAMPS